MKKGFDHGRSGRGAEANSEPELSPALAKALEIMTEKISSAIAEKLGPLAETVHNHTQQLETATHRLDEAERRIKENKQRHLRRMRKLAYSP